MNPLYHTGGTLFPRMVWWLTPDIRSRKLHPWKIPRLIGIFSQLQDFLVCANSVSSDLYALIKNRSRDSKINRRSHDIAIDYRAERCLQQRDAWCEDCVCIEKDSHEFALPKESKCRRATCPERRPILTRNADCLHDLRDFQATGGDEAVRGLSDLSHISLQNDDAQDFDKMGPSSCSSKWNTYGNGPGRLTQVKITGFCSASDCIGYVWTRECSKQRTTKRHIDQTMRTRNFRARREKRQRGEKRKASGRVLSVESYWTVFNWTMFERKLMQFQSWSSIWQQMRQEGRLSSPAPKAQATEKKPSQSLGRIGESPSGKGGRIACLHFLRWKCTNPSCSYWHPPVWSQLQVWIRMQIWRKMPIPTRWGLMGSPVRSRRKVVWRISCLTEGV